MTLWEESWINNCCASNCKGGSGNAWPERAVRDLPLPRAHGDSACAGHGSSDTGTLLRAHSQASSALESWVTQQGCSAAARECWGLELCIEVFSIYCNLCPGSGGKVKPSMRAVLGISKCKDCLWVPVCDIHRQSAENICKLQEACEPCPSQEHLLTVYCWLTLQIKFAWTAKRSVMGGSLTSKKLSSQHFGCLNYIWIKLLIKS